MSNPVSYTLANGRYRMTFETLFGVWQSYPERFPNVRLLVRHEDDLVCYPYYACLEVCEPPTTGGHVDVEEVARRLIHQFVELDKQLPGTVVDIEIHRDSVDGTLRSKKYLNPVPGLCLERVGRFAVGHCPLVEFETGNKKPTSDTFQDRFSGLLHSLNAENSRLMFMVKGYCRGQQGDDALIPPWNGRIQDLVEDAEVSEILLSRIRDAFIRQYLDQDPTSLSPQVALPKWDLGHR